MKIPLAFVMDFASDQTATVKVVFDHLSKTHCAVIPVVRKFLYLHLVRDIGYCCLFSWPTVI